MLLIRIGWLRIQVQHFMSMRGSESGSKNLMTKSCTFLRVEVLNFQIKLQYIYPYRPPWRTSMVYRRSLKPSKHRALYYSFFWFIFDHLVPDPDPTRPKQSESMRTLVITEATLEMLRFIGQRPYKATAHSLRKVFSRASVLVPNILGTPVFFSCPSFCTSCIFSGL